jgi:RimJ/RimL family protein N-acetyltransferase
MKQPVEVPEAELEDEDADAADTIQAVADAAARMDLEASRSSNERIHATASRIEAPIATAATAAAEASPTSPALSPFEDSMIAATRASSASPDAAIAASASTSATADAADAASSAATSAAAASSAALTADPSSSSSSTVATSSTAPAAAASSTDRWPLTPIGDLNLFLHDDFNLGDYGIAGGGCEIEIMVAEKSYRGRGLGLESLRALMTFSAERLGVERFVVKVLRENKPSVKLFEKLGFKMIEYVECFDECVYFKDTSVQEGGAGLFKDEGEDGELPDPAEEEKPLTAADRDHAKAVAGLD